MTIFNILAAAPCDQLEPLVIDSKALTLANQREAAIQNLMLPWEPRLMSATVVDHTQAEIRDQ